MDTWVKELYFYVVFQWECIRFDFLLAGYLAVFGEFTVLGGGWVENLKQNRIVWVGYCPSYMGVFLAQLS